MTDYSKYDYVLSIDSSINEATSDPRNYNVQVPSIDVNPGGNYIGMRDPKLTVNWAFGRQLQRNLNDLGSEYSCQVFDTGGEVSVTVTHCSTSTGRSASKSFIIVFGTKDGKGIIKSSSTRWRTISGIGQAISYIRSVASNLYSYTQSNG